MPAINQYPQLKAADGSDNVNFTQAGSNVVTRTVQDKLQDFVSVKDFGAVGNGIADDTIAIQNALNAGSVAQRPVWLPGGTYKVSSRLIVPTRTGLVSDGSATIYATAAGFNNTTVVGTYSNNSAVIDLSGQTTAPFTPNDKQVIQGIRVISEVADGRAVDAIVARNCTNLQIVDNEIANFPVTRAVVGASIIVGEISRNYIHDCTTNYTGWSPSRPQITGIDIDDDRINSIVSQRLRICDNIISDLTVGAAVLAYAGYETDGINIQNSPGTIVSGNRINKVGEGIDTFGSYGVITNNLITDTYNCGIKVIHGASLNVIQGNRIRNTGITGVLVAGSDIVGVGDTSKNLVSGNAVENVDYLSVWAAVTATGGIKMDNTGSLFVARNNLVIGNLLDGSGEYGIVTGSASHGNVFAQNRIVAAPSVAWIGGNETLRVTDALKTNLRAYLSTTQSINSATWTKVQIDVVNFDTRTEFDTSNNRWVCQIPGCYRVKGQVRFSMSSGTQLNIAIRKNNSQVVAAQAATNGIEQTFAIDDIVSCAVGDYLELFYRQDSGGAANITGNSELTFFSVSQV